MSVQINVTSECREELRQLSNRLGKPMSVLVEEAIRALDRQQLHDTLENRTVIKFLGELEGSLLVPLHQTLHEVVTEVTQKVLKEQQYKPWLRRKDADDIEELSETETEVENGDEHDDGQE